MLVARQTGTSLFVGAELARDDILLDLGASAEHCRHQRVSHMGLHVRLHIVTQTAHKLHALECRLLGALSGHEFGRRRLGGSELAVVEEIGTVVGQKTRGG